MARRGVLGMALAVACATFVHASGAGTAQEVRPPGIGLEALSRDAEQAWAAGRDDEALRLFRAGLELDPGWRDGLWRVAQISVSAGHFADARDALLRLVALEPDAGPAWALLGLCEHRLGAYDRAWRTCGGAPRSASRTTHSDARRSSTSACCWCAAGFRRGAQAAGAPGHPLLRRPAPGGRLRVVGAAATAAARGSAAARS